MFPASVITAWLSVKWSSSLPSCVHSLLLSLSFLLSPLLSLSFSGCFCYSNVIMDGNWAISPFFDFKEMEYFNKKLQRAAQEISKGHGKPQMWGAVSSLFAHLGGSGPLGIPVQGLKPPPASGGGSDPELHSFLTSLSTSQMSNRHSQHEGCPAENRQFSSPRLSPWLPLLVGTNTELMVKILAMTCRASLFCFCSARSVYLPRTTGFCSFLVPIHFMWCLKG